MGEPVRRPLALILLGMEQHHEVGRVVPRDALQQAVGGIPAAILVGVHLAREPGNGAADGGAGAAEREEHCLPIDRVL